MCAIKHNNLFQNQIIPIPTQKKNKKKTTETQIQNIQSNPGHRINVFISKFSSRA